MAGDDDSGEKTEKPTPKRLKDAREKGQVPHGKELVTFFSLLTIFLYIVLAYPYIITQIDDMYMISLSVVQDRPLLSMDQVMVAIKEGIVLMVTMLLPPVVIGAAVSGFVAMIQVGGVMFTPEVFELDMNKFNPAENFKNIASMKNLQKFLKDSLQLVIMFSLSYILVRNDMSEIINAAYHEVDVVIFVFFRVFFKVFVVLLIVFLIFAVIEYVIERAKFYKDMMMSLEDIKKEFKETEGNPEIKNRRKELHRELLEEENVEAGVKKSTLIVTNPTHIAIAIYFDPSKVKLPVVIMKAQGVSAKTVMVMAKKHNVVTVRDIWLARSLYSLGEVGKYCPPTLLTAVADIIGKNIHLMPKEIQAGFMKSVGAPITPDAPTI